MVWSLHGFIWKSEIHTNICKVICKSKPHLISGCSVCASAPVAKVQMDKWMDGWLVVMDRRAGWIKDWTDQQLVGQLNQPTVSCNGGGSEGEQGSVVKAWNQADMRWCTIQNVSRVSCKHWESNSTKHQ